MALIPDFQNTVQSSGRNTQTLGYGNIVLYVFVHFIAADNEHMTTAEQITGHINAVLMFGGNCIIQKMRQIQNRADRRKSGLIDFAAIDNGLIGVRKLLAAPCGGNVSKRFFRRGAPFSGVGAVHLQLGNQGLAE